MRRPLLLRAEAQKIRRAIHVICFLMFCCSSVVVENFWNGTMMKVRYHGYLGPQVRVLGQCGASRILYQAYTGTIWYCTSTYSLATPMSSSPSRK